MAYITKAGVREFAKRNDMRVSGEVFGALEKNIEELLRKATMRAKANGRKTLKAMDL